MTSYNDILNNTIDQDSPFTTTLLTYLRDNPIALVEGASGAPKIADKIIGGSDVSGNLDFGSLGDFSGILMWGVVYRTSPSSSILTLSYSTNGGSTFSASPTLFTLEQDESTPFNIFFDFATGDYFAAGGRGTYASGTIAGASLAINLVRLTTNNSSTLSAIAKPQGGQSAS